ncbi:MAG: iron ABC transporter permease [Actinomycetaceae bacterium]|nr:iron ABC transporter permease [Actinomycetaceae bacterium]
MKLDRTPWLVGSVLVVIAMLLPLLQVLSSFTTPASENWEHIRQHLLGGYLKDSAILVVGTALLSIILASALAWFVTAYDFPGQRFFRVALILPLAIPPYIAGYTYHAMLSYTGVVQVTLRNQFGVKPPPRLFDIQNLPGAIVIFTLFLYPYIYLVLRSFLDKQAQQLMEASAVLGASRLRTYWKVVVPLTRNAVIGGTTLVIFETLSDYGLVSYFGLNVFTTAVFNSWLGYRDLNAALRLAGVLLLVVFVISAGEKSLRGARSHSYASTRVTPLRRETARGWRKIMIFTLCWTVLSLALIIPLAQMIYWAILSLPVIRLEGLMTSFLMSFLLALAGAAIATVCALVVAQNQRLWPTPVSKLLARLTVMGYSIPSTVIALAILTIATWISQRTGWNLLSSVAMLIAAYVIRYLAVSMQAVEAGLDRIGTRYHEASRTLGRGPTRSTFLIDVPMARTALLSGFLLAFIDMVKELPLVLILRPFNLSTLATRVFEYAHDEQIPESALASLLIVLLALIPTLVLVWKPPKGANRD